MLSRVRGIEWTLASMRMAKNLSVSIKGHNSRRMDCRRRREKRMRQTACWQSPASLSLSLPSFPPHGLLVSRPKDQPDVLGYIIRDEGLAEEQPLFQSMEQRVVVFLWLQKESPDFDCPLLLLFSALLSPPASLSLEQEKGENQEPTSASFSS